MASEELTVATLSKSQRRKLQAYSYPKEVGGTLGVLSMMMTIVIAVRFPAYYWIWHLVRATFYIPTRYWRFRERKWELYLLDWCYFVTYLSNACAILAFLRITFGIETPLVKYNASLIQAGFAMACGPLAWSVYVFRNSIVFYDVDRLTSSFIHLSPCILFWCLRWGAGLGPSVIQQAFPDMFHVCDSDDYAAADACLTSIQGAAWCDACSVPASAFIVKPAFLYFTLWSVPYFLIIFVWCRDWIERTNHETLYSYFATSQPALHAMLERNLKGVFGSYYAGPVGYMLFHFVMSVASCSLSYFMWHSFLLHSLVLLTMIVQATHNGSTYMFRVFAYRYAEEQLQKHKTIFE